MRGKRRFVLIAAFIVLVFFIFAFVQKQTLHVDVEQPKEFIRSFGILGPIVFSPLTSFPFWVASLALFGFLPTCFYTI